MNLISRASVVITLAVVAVLVALCTAVLLIGQACRQPVITLTPVPSTPGTAWYEVYFTTPKFPDRKEDHHGGIDTRLVAFLNTARRSIDMAIYDFDLDNVAEALITAKRRGVTVRLVTDTDHVDDPTFKKLKAAGIPVVDDQRGPIMHNKFVVVDGARVWTGSWNFTEFDTYRFDNNALAISSPELARNYTTKFQAMFEQRLFGPNRPTGTTTPRLTIGGIQVENYFAPEDKVAEKIIARLNTAQQSIDFMAFSFTDNDIGKVVRERAKAGVKVRGVFETTGSETEFSEYLSMKKQGLDVWQDGNPYLMHHKVFIIDQRTVIVGSFNFSKNAAEENDENLLIIDDPVLAQQFLAEFGRVYQAARAKG
jgi:phosphatidylserine/phosphatidylglycerophosphate/cardiolipin synthase-like enzyme